MSSREPVLIDQGGRTGAQRRLLDERMQRARLILAKSSGTTVIPRRPAGAEIPLSFAQERLWFLGRLEPASPVYNVCAAVRLTGPIDAGRLERALNSVIARHEALRTNFLPVENGAVQVVAPGRTLPLPVVDLADGDEAGVEEELQRRLTEEARRPFDLERDLLVRARLVRTRPAEHTLLLTLHHLVSDGWSLGVLFRELAALYQTHGDAGSTGLPELPIQFADYVCWERERLQGPALEKLLGYWRRQLAGPLPGLDLPADHPRPGMGSSRGAVQSRQLSPALTQALKALSQREGATLYMTLLAAFQVLLHRWTGQDDIVVGSVVAGRRRTEVEKLIGFFVNTLVLRGDLRGNPDFRGLLARVRETVLGALAHQELPFDRLVAALQPERNASRNPVFQVMFVLQNAAMAPLQLPGVRVEPVDIDTGTAKFDLTLTMVEGPRGLRAGFEYNLELFEPATISRWLGCLQTLLEGIVAGPEQAIARLPLLTAAERHQLIHGWNQTRSDYPRERTVADLFARQAARAPGAVALEFRGESVTYGELDRRANRLAARLRRAGVGANIPVGVCSERSPEAIVALVAILKAGGCYVSLDPAYPDERLACMLADTRAPVLLVQPALRARLAAIGERAVELRFPRENGAAAAAGPAEIVSLEWAVGAPAECAAEAGAPVVGIRPEHLAYVSYTSGSTGRPKGVMVPHRAVVRLVVNPDFAHFGPDEVFLQYAPIAFDASTLEIWGALLNGARLVIVPPGPASLAGLGEVIERSGVTTLWLTAGLFHQMVEHRIERLRNVRQLLAGGDVLSPSHVARALARLPRTQLINGYGPTENTTFTCCHRITAPPAPGRPVPIGRPIANTQVYLLDRELQPVPIGVAGELYAGGDGLAGGYLNQPARTAERFVPHPFSPDPGARLYRTGDLARWLPEGVIEFLGRVDRQVKIRGFRVEPGEVEAALARHPAIRGCAVVVRDDAAGERCLVAYLALRESPAPVAGGWREWLAERLPEHLIPAGFVTVPAIPLTANGKVDTEALPAWHGPPPPPPRRYVAPRDAVERQLAEIWETVLGIHPIGVHDRYFELGGHSLLAVRLVAQIEKRCGCALPLTAIFQHCTIERLAPLVRGGDRRYTTTGSLVEIQGRGTQPPLYLVHGVGGGMFWGYANLARHLGPDQPLYAFKSRGLDGLPEWPTIEEMAANYVADLRRQQPRGPYQIGGYCFGGIVAYEMARQLRAQGEQVALLALLNCSPPNSGYERPDASRSAAWYRKFAVNLAYWIGCFLFRWTLRERFEFIRWKLRVLGRRAGGLLAGTPPELAAADVDELVNLALYSEQQRLLWEDHVRALQRYLPQPYTGEVTLLRTRGHALWCTFDDHYGWGPLAQGGVVMKLMPGGHGNILDEPHVRTVAQALRSCLPPSRPAGEARP